MAVSKPWESQSGGRRATATRERRRVLIVCEDTKSSRYYFAGFKANPERAEIVPVGTGMNTDSLVEEAVRLVDRATQVGRPYSDVWCVFDRDSFPLERYSRAFQLAQTNRFKVAWSNEAFELWYLLHFHYLDAGISRDAYQAKLEDCGLDYDKADVTIFAKVKDRQATAMKNAGRLERHWHEMGVMFPERQNPSTGVHKLVEFLNDLAELGTAD